MKCENVISALEKIAPCAFAEKWDNVGLLTGRRDKEIRKVLIAVDATSDVIKEAVNMGADFLLTHHPLIFSGMKSITTDDFIGNRIYTLIGQDICYYAMHTNFDVCIMAQAVAEQLQLQDCHVLEPAACGNSAGTDQDEIGNRNPVGIGCIGFLPEKMTLKEFGKYLSEKCSITGAKIFGDPASKVHKVALVPGSGKDYIDQAIRKGADVFLTGDVGHHPGMDAVEKGISVIDAGHYGLEKVFSAYMSEVLQKEFPDVEVEKAKEQPPFWTLNL